MGISRPASLGNQATSKQGEQQQKVDQSTTATTVTTTNSSGSTDSDSETISYAVGYIF